MKKIELPDGFSSWSELYSHMESSGLAERELVSVFCKPTDEVPISQALMYKTFSVKNIREMLLQELWEEKKAAIKGLKSHRMPSV